MLRKVITMEQLKTGLWHSYDQLRDMSHAERMLNVVCKPYGIIPYTPVQQAFNLTDYDMEFNWLIQLLRLDEVMLLPYGSLMYKVTEAYSPEVMNLVDYNNFAYPATINEGTWHVADFGKFWMLTNGVDIVFSPYTEVVGVGEHYPVCSGMPVNTITNANGRLIMGGFDKDNFWKPDFSNLISQLGHIDEYGLQAGLEVDQNYVFWSSPGGDILWLLYPDKAIYGNESRTLYDESEPFILDLFRRQDMAFAKMPFSGAVQKVMPMQIEGKTHVIAYSSNGVSLLYPVVQPYVGYGIAKLLKGSGSFDRNTVAGNEFKQLMIDASGVIWLNIVGKFTRLGYEHLIRSMLGNGVVVTYDELNDWFYIGNGETTYLLSDSGLSETNQAVPSVHSYEGQAVGLVEELGYGDSIMIEYYLSEFEFGGLKQIYSVEATYDTSEEDNYLEVSWKYRMSAVGNWAQTGWRRANMQGAVVYPITAYEIILCLRWADYSTVNLPKQIIVWYNDLDTRNIRGYYGRTKTDDVRE